LISALLLLFLAVPASRLDGWTPNGAPLCLAPGSPYEPAVCADFAGGVTVVWTDLRDGVDSGHVFAARVVEDGTVDSGWPVDGFRVSTDPSPQRAPSVLPAPDGGSFVLLHSIGATSTELRLQRLTSRGAVAPGWPAEGRVVGGPMVTNSAFGSMRADSTGAFFVAHVSDDSISRTIRLFRFGPEGEPAPGWPAEGVLALQEEEGPGESFELGLDVILDDDRQGGIWTLSRTYIQRAGAFFTRWRLVRMTSLGSLPSGWPAPGALVADERPGSAGYPRRSGVAVAGGSFLFCYIESDAEGSFIQGRIYDPDGSSRELGPIAESEGNLPRGIRLVTADGRGGALIEFEEFHVGSPPARKLWRVGFAVPDPVLLWSAPYLTQGDAFLGGLPFGDGEGGIYAFFDPNPSGPLRMTHLQGATGAWDPPSSFPSGLPFTELDPDVAYYCGTRTRHGGLALFWVGNRRGQYDLYYTGSVTPMSALATPREVTADGDRVEIEWWIDPAVAIPESFERSQEADIWEGCGFFEWSQAGRLRTVDPDPPPGSIQYRLRGPGPEGEVLSEIVTVDRPIPEIRVRLVVRSPQRSGLTFHLEGDPGRTVELRCIDVTGREVARVSAVSGFSGPFRIELPPGLYFLQGVGGPGLSPRRVVVLP